MFPHIDNLHLVLDFVLANLAAELVKYIGVKFYAFVDYHWKTFLDLPSGS